MFKTARYLAPLFCLTALLAGAVQAQTIKVDPASIGIGLGATQKFNATVTGLTNTAVVWSVNNQGSGNATVGTIDQTGLYTAPAAIPAQAPTIYATSVSNPTVKGTVNLWFLTAGPTITSVSPNPLPGGSYNITVTGTGFLTGARIVVGGVALGTTLVNSTTVKSTGNWQSPSITSTTVYVNNPGSTNSNTLVIPVSGTGGSSGSGGGGSGGGTSAPVVSPAAISVTLGATQQFTAAGATAWSAFPGTITSAGLYTAPSTMPGSSAVTVTASNSAGSSTAKVTLVSNIPPTLSSVSPTQFPLGIFSATLSGTGFTAQSVAQLGGTNLATGFVNATTLNVSGFASVTGPVNLTVSNGSLTSAAIQVQVGNPLSVVSAAAARRFLEQGAFGPTPSDAAHVQAVGFQGWLNEQFAMPVLAPYVATSSSNGLLRQQFLTNAVMNADQLRQRVAFALSQIFVVSENKLIWDPQVAPFENILLNDAFANYRKIMADVTLDSSMGYFLDMGNNAKANPAIGAVANENYAREIMQLFSMGTTLLNPDGTIQLDQNNVPAAAYNQFNITELARVLTGWTYPGPYTWNSYNHQTGPMFSNAAYHDMGSKQLLNYPGAVAGGVAQANLSPQQDLDFALDNIFNHPNVGPFVSRQLIQHLVKSNPSPAYVQRVAAAFNNNGQGVRGDMKAVVTAVLLDPEARANDNGGQDQVTDGHLQEPVLYIAGIVRAFGGTMTMQNYFGFDLYNMHQDVFNPASVFNYYSPMFTAPGTGLQGGEFQIYTPDIAVYRANMVANFLGAYNNPVQGYGPGTTVDLTPFVALAPQPATLVAALDLTLTHGTMPATMKNDIIAAVAAETQGNVFRVEDAVWLIITSGYYNVWH